MKQSSVRLFNVMHSVITKAGMHTHVKCGFSGVQEKFSLDALPDATNDQ